VQENIRKKGIESNCENKEKYYTILKNMYKGEIWW